MNKRTVGFSLSILMISAIGHVAQAQDSSGLRKVQGQTIVSPDLPRADLTFGEKFHYVGGQRVNLYNMAEAEQHLFVHANNGVIDTFYWVQFEHRLPTDHHTYNYPADHTTEIGGLKFVYDTKSWPDFPADLMEDPESDGAAISRLASEHHLTFPKRAVRVRMFHLPTPDRRTELMIIYGEALPESSPVPVREGGVELNKESPAEARRILESAQRSISIRKK